MKLDDGTLRDLFEDPALAIPRADRGCPDPATARALATGDVTEAERLAFVDHLVECRDCASEHRASGAVARWSDEAAVRVIRAPAENAPSSPEDLRPGRAGTRFATWTTLAAAAAVIAAVGIALVLVRRTPNVSTTGTSGERGTGAIVMAATLPPDGASLASPPSRLAWEALPGATGYEVSIYDSESSPIWKSARITSPTVDVPPEVAAKLPAGRSYLWRVVARVGLDARPSSVYGFSVSP